MTRLTPSGGVVVGVDGSDEALDAVAVAARWAARSASSLRILHAWVWPLYRVKVGPIEGVKDSGLQRAAEEVLETAEARARQAAPEIAVSTELVVGKSAEELLRASTDAALVVVASRGVGGFAGLLLGSTGLYLQAYAQCPVLIVRGAENPNGPVIVGFDGSPESEHAVEYTAGVASQAGRSLVIVHAHPSRSRTEVPPDESATDPESPSVDPLLDHARQIAHRAAPEVEIATRAVEHTSAAGALVEASTDASLIAVGPRGRGHVRGSIGSTAQAVVQHASCPVLMVKR